MLFSSENCEQHPDPFTHCPYEYLDAIGQENSVVTVETLFLSTIHFISSISNYTLLRRLLWVKVKETFSFGGEGGGPTLDIAIEL